MIDVKELKVLNRTDCKCGNHKFTLADLQKLENLTDTHGFYANLVKHYSLAECPECQNRIVMLLRQKGQTWEVMNTAELAQVTDGLVQVDEPTYVQVYDDSIEQTTLGLNEQKEANQEFICPECNRAFKNKSGLTNHMKTHNK